MAKTIQALKITALVALSLGKRQAAATALFEDSAAEGVFIAGAKLRVYHAIVARYDDPTYSVRVTERIAQIKAALAENGEIEAWNVVAGAVPIADAEVLPDVPAAAAE